MNEHETNESYRFNYVLRHKDEIIAQKIQIEDEYKKFFFDDEYFLEYCKKQSDWEKIKRYKYEPFERLKEALALDLKKPVEDSIHAKMTEAIEKVWVDESAEVFRFAFQKEYQEKLDSGEIKNPKEALEALSESYKEILADSRKRIKEFMKNE